MNEARPHPKTERPLEADLLVFDLHEQLRRLKAEDVWKDGQRNAITLWKGPFMRVVLVALRSGAVLADHQAEGPVTVQVVEGSVDFVAESTTKSLGEGQVVTMHGGVRHRVEARTEAAFLITMAVRPSGD